MRKCRGNCFNELFQAYSKIKLNKHLDRSVANSLNCLPQYGGYKDTHVALKQSRFQNFFK